MGRQFEANLPWNDNSGASYESTYTNLAAAIVMTAVKDYVRLLRKSWEKGLTVAAKRRLVMEKAELEDFFFSAWYGTLTDIDPARLVRQCQKNAVEQEKASIVRQNRKRIKEMRRAREAEEPMETECNEAEKVGGTEKINEMEENTI